VAVTAITAIGQHEILVLGGAEVEQWRESHRMPVPGAEHTRLFKRKQWDGTWAPGQWCRMRGEQYELRCWCKQARRCPRRSG